MILGKDFPSSSRKQRRSKQVWHTSAAKETAILQEMLGSHETCNLDNDCNNSNDDYNESVSDSSSSDESSDGTNGDIDPKNRDDEIHLISS
jgi:hypothetical protein